MAPYADSEVVLQKVGDPPSEALLNSLATPQQQQALLNCLREEDPHRKQQIITQNLRRVVNIANRYCNHGVAILDLIKEGIQGLIHALENFEREGGFRFESYAVQCVRHSIERVILSRSPSTYP